VGLITSAAKALGIALDAPAINDAFENESTE